jgi:outer membrane protein OmpA-like peptidoglycan-associated protein
VRRLAAITLIAIVPAVGSAPPDPSPPTAEQLAVGPECADRDGATVTHLPDIVVPAIEVAAASSPDVEIGGETVAGGVVPGFTLPEQVVDAGCVIEYAAPGGCLGAIEVTGATIPGVTIPVSVIPDVELPDGRVVAGTTIAEVVVDAVSVEGVRTEQVCQVELDGELPTVTRPGVVRQGQSRPGAARPGAARPETCAGAECVPELRVDAVELEPVELPDVDVEPARLRRQELDVDESDVDVDVFEGDATTSFVAPGDVLFDTDSATLRPDATAALTAVAEELVATAAPDAPVRVEGHTDDRADEAYNLDLSLRRAQAVADWLVANAAIAAERLVVTGLGETAPAYPNDSDANRQLNRRVVITVSSG